MTKDEEIYWLRCHVNPWTLMHAIERNQIPIGIGIPLWSHADTDPLGLSLMHSRQKMGIEE
jgi:hypothetical protein